MTRMICTRYTHRCHTCQSKCHSRSRPCSLSQLKSLSRRCNPLPANLALEASTASATIPQNWRCRLGAQEGPNRSHYIVIINNGVTTRALPRLTRVRHEEEARPIGTHTPNRAIFLRRAVCTPRRVARALLQNAR